MIPPKSQMFRSSAHGWWFVWCAGIVEWVSQMPDVCDNSTAQSHESALKQWGYKLGNKNNELKGAKWETVEGAGILTL